MSIEFLKFGNIEIEKQKFHSSRNPVTTDDMDINKILISDRFARGKRVLTLYFPMFPFDPPENIRKPLVS